MKRGAWWLWTLTVAVVGTGITTLLAASWWGLILFPIYAVLMGTLIGPPESETDRRLVEAAERRDFGRRLSYGSTSDHVWLYAHWRLAEGRLDYGSPELVHPSHRQLLARGEPDVEKYGSGAWKTGGPV